MIMSELPRIAGRSQRCCYVCSHRTRSLLNSPNDGQRWWLGVMGRQLVPDNESIVHDCSCLYHIHDIYCMWSQVKYVLQMSQTAAVTHDIVGPYAFCIDLTHLLLHVLLLSASSSSSIHLPVSLRRLSSSLQHLEHHNTAWPWPSK